MWLLSGQIREREPIRDIHINPFPFRVGRRSDASLTISSPAVSNLHAEIVHQDGHLVLRDLGSTNGTFLNGRRICDEALLHEGDLIQFANCVFRVKQQDPIDPTETVQGEKCDRALALIQFDRLINERAIVPHFQPIVRSSDNVIVGYEVLGRSDLFNLKTPCVMFQAAQQLNLESELSRLCRWAGMEAGVRLSAPTNLFLNTHPSELGDTEVLKISLYQLREAFPDLPATLEIHEASVTSSAVMQDLTMVLDELDFGLAYDDFGSGQARLVELIEIPPHVLKFERRLIAGLDRASAQRRGMVANLVEMVRQLGILPLAEGMETESEARTCIELGFQLHQGFYYGHPAPIEKILS